MCYLFIRLLVLLVIRLSVTTAVCCVLVHRLLLPDACASLFSCQAGFRPVECRVATPRRARSRSAGPSRHICTPAHAVSATPYFWQHLSFARHFAGAGAGIEGTRSAERGAWNWAGPVQPDRCPVIATRSHLGRPTSGGRARDPKPRLGSHRFDLSLPHSIPIYGHQAP